jgi:hypothetical protein
MFALFFSLFVYSQDCANETDVDVWISEHQTEIQIMKREDWLKLNETLKLPVYSKFTAEQCYHFWIDKVNEVIRSFDWNESEKIHLNLLLNTVSDNPKWFENDKIDKEAFEAFFSAWTEYAQDTLGWHSHFIGAILATGNKVLNKKGDVETKQI